jgi:hypothetical protein
MSYTRNQDEINNRWSAVMVGLCAAGLAVLIYFTTASCNAPLAGRSQVNWHKADIAGDEAIALLEAASVTWAHDPGVVKDLQRVKAAVQLVDAAVDSIIAGEGDGGLDLYLFAAIALVDELAAQAEDDDLRATLTSVRLALGMARVLAA